MQGFSTGSCGGSGSEADQGLSNREAAEGKEKNPKLNKIRERVVGIYCVVNPEVVYLHHREDNVGNPDGSHLVVTA